MIEALFAALLSIFVSTSTLSSPATVYESFDNIEPTHPNTVFRSIRTQVSENGWIMFSITDYDGESIPIGVSGCSIDGCAYNGITDKTVRLSRVDGDGVWADQKLRDALSLLGCTTQDNGTAQCPENPVGFTFDYTRDYTDTVIGGDSIALTNTLFLPSIQN